MAISVVQSNKANASSVSFGSNTTAGNCLVVAYCTYLTSLAPTNSAVTIGGSADHFTLAVSHLTSGIGGFEYLGVWLWYDYNCVGGQTAIAVTETNGVVSPEGGTFIYEVSGLGTTSSILDQTNNAGSTSSSTYSSGSITTTIPNEIVFGAEVSSVAPGAPSGFTTQTTADTIVGYEILTSTSTLSYNGTLTSGGNAAVIASFKAKSSGGPMLAFPF